MKILKPRAKRESHCGGTMKILKPREKRESHCGGFVLQRCFVMNFDVSVNFLGFSYRAFLLRILTQF